MHDHDLPQIQEQIRIAVATDVEALLPMIRELFRDESIPWDIERTRVPLRHLLEHAELGQVLIAMRGDSACGYAIVTWGYDLEYEGRDAFLTELWVAPAERGRGLGARLLAGVEQRAQQLGAGAVHLQVRTDNPGAQRIYRRSGFVASPRIFMSKRL
jgi:ribosomal protein S18 acetylase RimI-like enzyme